jgi:hypothetical protein
MHWLTLGLGKPKWLHTSKALKRTTANGLSGIILQNCGNFRRLYLEVGVACAAAWLKLITFTFLIEIFCRLNL